MSVHRTVIVTSVIWVTGISFLHAWLNLGLFAPKPASSAKTFRVGFLPVT